MTRLTKIALASLLSLSAAATASAESSKDSSDELSVVLVKRATSAKCGDAEVKRELNVCHDAKGCYKRNLNRNQGVTFKLPSHGSFSLVAHGPLENVRTAFRSGEEIPERITQTIEGKNECTLTFTYRIVK